MSRRLEPTQPAQLSQVARGQCDHCGCSVDTDLIHPDGHHYADGGDFYCTDCRAKSQ